MIVIFAGAFQNGLWVNSLLEAAKELKVSQEMENDPARATTIKTISVIGQIFVWVAILLFAIDKISGVKLNAIIASLDNGGIDAGTAVKNFLDELVAFLSLTLE